MPVEDDTLASGSTTVTRNLCGARGIDAISQTTTTGTTWAFPVYDGHGNMVATLARGSGTTFSVGNRRDYDVWGGVRSGAGTGAPSNRYCANLGHVQDDESGLVYMRSRYYEAGAGRFLSEDIARDGSNYFMYCFNSPVQNTDSTGKSPDSAAWAAGGAFWSILGCLFAWGCKFAFMESCIGAGAGFAFCALVCCIASAYCYAYALAGVQDIGLKEVFKMAGSIGAAGTVVAMVAGVAAALKAGTKLQAYAGGVAMAMLVKCADYALQCIGAMICIENGW